LSIHLAYEREHNDVPVRTRNMATKVTEVRTVIDPMIANS